MILFFYAATVNNTVSHSNENLRILQDAVTIKDGSNYTNHDEDNSNSKR